MVLPKGTDHAGPDTTHDEPLPEIEVPDKHNFKSHPDGRENWPSLAVPIAFVCLFFVICIIVYFSPGKPKHAGGADIGEYIEDGNIGDGVEDDDIPLKDLPGPAGHDAISSPTVYDPVNRSLSQRTKSALDQEIEHFGASSSVSLPSPVKAPLPRTFFKDQRDDAAVGSSHSLPTPPPSSLITHSYQPTTSSLRLQIPRKASGLSRPPQQVEAIDIDRANQPPTTPTTATTSEPRPAVLARSERTTNLGYGEMPKIGESQLHDGTDDIKTVEWHS